MIQRLLYCNIAKLGFRGVQERTARSREPDAPHLVYAASTKALVHGVMLAVDRQKRLALAARFRGDQLPGCNQAFFISEPYGFTRFHSFVSCFQSSHANDG